MKVLIFETEKHAAEMSLLNQRVFGAVIEADKAYSRNYPDEQHSLKHYKKSVSSSRRNNL